MKLEFEGMVGQVTEDTQYRVIETVYMYHPSIETKQDIANLFLLKGGMTIIYDMYARASKVQDVELEIQKKRTELAAIVEKLNEVKIATV